MKLILPVVFSVMASMAVPSHAQRAILPHGDPTIDADATPAQREDIREQRLKQQGQGEHYRIGGEPADDTSSAGAEKGPMMKSPGQPPQSRHDGGLADPTANPGQAGDPPVREATVLRLIDHGYVVRDARGQEVTLLVDQDTAGDKDLTPGDRIEMKVTPQGRAIAITKESEGAGSKSRGGQR